MKFVFTADLHLKHWNDKEFTTTGIPLKLYETLNAFEQMCKYAQDNSIKTIIIGGDLNDTKGIVNVRSFILFQQIIDKYNDLHFIMIPGNHDATMRKSVEWAVELINGNNVTIYKEPTEMDDITFIPWMGEEISSAIKECEPNKILVSHLGLNEGHLASGISLRSSVTTKSLSRFKLVLLGHYHSPQQVEHCYYVGSPIPFRRDEVKDIKRFLVVDTDDLKNVVSVPITGYRKYIEIVIDEESDSKEIKEIIEKNREDGNFIVLKNNAKHIDEAIKSIAEESNKIQLINQYSPEFQVRGITSGMSDEDQMKKYLEIENIPEEKNQKYLNIGLNAIRKS